MYVARSLCELSAIVAIAWSLKNKVIIMFLVHFSVPFMRWSTGPPYTVCKRTLRMHCAATFTTLTSIRTWSRHRFLRCARKHSRSVSCMCTITSWSCRAHTWRCSCSRVRLSRFKHPPYTCTSKNKNQLAFLGAHILFYGFMNCLVHAVMYYYYFMSTYDRERLQKSCWLTKQNVTKLQLVNGINQLQKHHIITYQIPL